jgi:hypothetical protein
VERGGSLLLAFHAFHSPAISTAFLRLFFCFCFILRVFVQLFSLQLDGAATGLLLS